MPSPCSFNRRIAANKRATSGRSSLDVGSSGINTVALVDAGNGFDEGAFACAVFGHQRVDLTGANVEVHVAERDHAGESVGQFVRPQQVVHFRRFKLEAGCIMDSTSELLHSIKE